jgi:perosamine synthetase
VAGAEEGRLSCIPIIKPVLDDREVDAARRVILSGWLTQGQEVAAFEREFAELVRAPHACAVSSCTAALHLALLTVGAGPGDEVLTVSHSFIATANAVRYCGADPVFVDIEPNTYNINPELIEAALSPRTRAILVVHQMGMPCNLEPILALARRRSIPVIEDAACATGSEILWRGRWERIGRPHGDIACFSFHPRKVLTTGDGGMITSANEELDARFRLLRQHAMSVADNVRHASHKVIFESYPMLGFNYRMTDIQAAVGREQLKRLDDIVAGRRLFAQRYDQLLADIPGLRCPYEPSWARSNWQSYCVRLPESCNQRRVMQAMLDAGVATRRGIMCAHREPAYAEARIIGSLTESEAAQDHGLILPLFPQMTLADQQRVAFELRAACTQR